MNGLLVLQPYAKQIIDGTKEFEHRTRRPPTRYLYTPIYLLSQGKILGIIKIIGYLPDVTDIFTTLWRIKVISRYKKPKPYLHPRGAQTWVKNVNKIQTRLETWGNSG